MNQKINYNGKNPRKHTDSGSTSSSSSSGYGGHRRKESSGTGKFENKDKVSSEGYRGKPQGAAGRYENKDSSSSEGYDRKAEGDNNTSRFASRDSGNSEGYDRKTRGTTTSRYAKKRVHRGGSSIVRELIKDERYSNEQELKNVKVIDEPVKNEKFLRNDGKSQELEDEIRENLVEGRNAVIEVLKSTTTVEQILVSKGDTEGSISVIIALAKEKGIVVKEVDRKKLDSMSYTGAHQGVIAIVTPYNYFEVQDILNLAKERKEKPFIIVVDEIEDPHNLGSLIRTAEIVGAHGLIIPKRRNVGITPIVYKASAGATSHMRIAKVSNINMAIKELKKNGVWIYGADMDGKDYCFNADLTGAVALVVGSEGRGISKLTKEKCDVLIKIPMVGNINSYNASVAGGILMYEVLKQKLQK